MELSHLLLLGLVEELPYRGLGSDRLDEQDLRRVQHHEFRTVKLLASPNERVRDLLGVLIHPALHVLHIRQDPVRHAQLVEFTEVDLPVIQDGRLVSRRDPRGEFREPFTASHTRSPIATTANRTTRLRVPLMLWRARSPSWPSRHGSDRREPIRIRFQ